jgi:hypothetical protein
MDDFTPRQAAGSLGRIDPGNQQAIAALEKLLVSPGVRVPDIYVVETLERIDPGNQQAVAALVKLLASPGVNGINRWEAAEILGQIGTGNQAKVVKGIKAYLNAFGIFIYDEVYETLWYCAQNMPYRDFYKVWHRDKLQNFAKSVKRHLEFLGEFLTENFVTARCDNEALLQSISRYFDDLNQNMDKL